HYTLSGLKPTKRRPTSPPIQDVMDWLVPFISACPILETLDIYFDPEFLTNVLVPTSSKTLKFTGENLSWTYFEIDSDWLDVK
ncbi:F-box/RNI/FBD-like domain protein, partial [Trifolium medium]|nr:F-box/RNI/FBD-like domain protein [Trifolium medium]